jgi:hypothetical protein
VFAALSWFNMRLLEGRGGKFLIRASAICMSFRAVLGTDLARARRVASRLRTGRVVINGMMDDPQAPWGGFKYSGVGREYGRYGIEAFLETRAILEA